MTGLAKWFLHDDGRLRAGWRLLIFVFFFVALFLPLQGAAAAAARELRPRSPFASSLIFTFAFSAAAFLATWMMTRIFEKLPFSSVGFPCGVALRDSARGVAMGAGMVVLTAIGERAAGAIQFEPAGVEFGAVLNTVAAASVLFVVSALNEEMLFRGYGFQRLIEGTSGWVAVALSSVVFGVVHWRNPHATAFSVANTVLAGVLISVAYLKTRALWLPLGFHFAWNWSLFALGLPVSGMQIDRIPWTAIPVEGKSWLSGGDYGPEGGAIATATLVLGLAILLKVRGATVMPEAPSQDGGDSV